MAAMASPRNLPVGSAVRAASASRARSGSRGASGHVSSGHQPSAPSPRRNSGLLRPGSADSADSARRAMGGSPRIVMSPLHPRKGARGDGSTGPPTPKEQELREVCRQVAELAPQKFASVREAFRYLTPDHNGRVSRSQVFYFFRAYGVESAQAARLFAYFNPSPNDDIDGHKFVAYFRRHINPDDPEVEDCDSQSMCSSAAGLSCTAAERQCSKLQNEFHYLLQEVREKAPQRFSHVREALRIVDTDYDGCITRQEMQHFFRAFGIDEMRSDKLFEKMKTPHGGANYHTFVQVVGPFLELPGVVAAIRPSRPQSARSGSRSGRSRPPSANRSPAVSRPVSPAVSERKSISESALSESGHSCLPALARPPGHTGPVELPAAAAASPRKCPASPLPSYERAATPTSARGDRRPSKGSIASNHSRNSRPLSASRSGSVRASPRQSPRVQHDSSPMKDRSQLSQQTPYASPQPALAPPSPQIIRTELDHQLLLGNFQPLKPAGDSLFRPAPPQPSNRAGRRPMGNQRDVADVRQGKDQTYVGNLQPAELVTAASHAQHAMMSGGCPVATPLRRPSSRGRAQCESS